MANPLMAFLAFFLPCTRRSVVFSLSLAGCGLAGYILATALLSPAMLGSQAVGGGAVVLTWLFSAAIFSFLLLMSSISVFLVATSACACTIRAEI